MEEMPSIRPQLHPNQLKVLLENLKKIPGQREAERRRCYELSQRKYHDFLEQLENEKTEIILDEDRNNFPISLKVITLLVTGAALSSIFGMNSILWFDIGFVLTLVGAVQLGWILLKLI